MVKSNLLNFLKDINFMYNDCGMHDSVSKMLEDFEAEIREKAYDRFLTEMLNEFDSRNADIEEHTGSYVVSRLHAVAEQLKESE